jgi:hypothetical protein
LTENTITAIVRPGKMDNQGETSMYVVAPRFSIPPHEAISGGIPTPKKLKDASTTMA